MMDARVVREMLKFDLRRGMVRFEDPDLPERSAPIKNGTLTVYNGAEVETFAIIGGKIQPKAEPR